MIRTIKVPNEIDHGPDIGPDTVSWDRPLWNSPRPVDRALALWRDKNCAQALLPFLGPDWGLGRRQPPEHAPSLAHVSGVVFWREGDGSAGPTMVIERDGARYAIEGANPLVEARGQFVTAP